MPRAETDVLDSFMTNFHIADRDIYLRASELTGLGIWIGMARLPASPSQRGLYAEDEHKGYEPFWREVERLKSER